VVELVYNKTTKEPAHGEAYAFDDEVVGHGMLFGHSKYADVGNVQKIKPPLGISDAEAAKVMQVFEEIVEKLELERSGTREGKR
jgi:4-aminobutyrate aminotransferase/4-aminobutyrate aminotransferase/(S)-3-amino-2-methylpropionate transaminase